MEAQTEDTPTPAPTAMATPDGTEETDASADSGSESEQSGKADGPKYGNMDSILNDLVEQVEGGIASARSAASTAPVSDDESVAVSLFVEEDYVEAVRQYLDENGASVRFAELDTIEAYVPVTLLGNVSQQGGSYKRQHDCPAASRAGNTKPALPLPCMAQITGISPV